MDLSFSLQALSAEYLAHPGRELAPRVYPVPLELDRRVALAALGPMEAAVDDLTEAQKAYLASWEGGT
jgi:adenosylhomocysteinase